MDTCNQIPPPNMPDIGNAKDYLELPPTTSSIFTLKNATWRTYLTSFTVQYCFLFRFVCIELVSLISFLQIWVAIYVYGTMINWSTLIKKLMQTYIVKVSGSILNVSTVHLNSIWHLIWYYLSKPVLGGHPVLSGHYSIPRGCQINTGFIVFYWQHIPDHLTDQLVPTHNPQNVHPSLWLMKILVASLQHTCGLLANFGNCYFVVCHDIQLGTCRKCNTS